MRKYLNIIKNFFQTTYSYFFIFVFLIFAVYILVIIYQNVYGIYQTDKEPTTMAGSKNLLNLTLYQEIVEKKETKQSPYRPSNLSNPFFANF